MKAFIRILFLAGASIVLWLFPTFAEEHPGYLAHKDDAYGVFYAGIAVVSAAYGFRQPWRRMPDIFFLLFAPLCQMAIRPGMLLPVTIFMGVNVCATSFMVARGFACCCSFRAKNSPHSNRMSTAMTILFFASISAALKLLHFFTTLHGFYPTTMFIIGAVEIPVISMIWGVRHSWHKMPFVLILLLAPVCEIIIRHNEFWLGTLFFLLNKCVMSYALGRGMAWACKKFDLKRSCGGFFSLKRL